MFWQWRLANNLLFSQNKDWKRYEGKSSIIVCGILFCLPMTEATSWSVSESDLTGQGCVDEDEDDVNLAPDGGHFEKIISLKHKQVLPLRLIPCQIDWFAGWGWVVVAASFVIHLIADGITFSFGVIYAELLDYFEEKKGYTAVIGSLFMATPLLSGPLASSLTDRFGCRKVTIAGSIVAALGLFLSSMSSKSKYFSILIRNSFSLIANQHNLMQILSRPCSWLSDWSPDWVFRFVTWLPSP